MQHFWSYTSNSKSPLNKRSISFPSFSLHRHQRLRRARAAHATRRRSHTYCYSIWNQAVFCFFLHFLPLFSLLHGLRLQFARCGSGGVHFHTSQVVRLLQITHGTISDDIFPNILPVDRPPRPHLPSTPRHPNAHVGPPPPPIRVTIARSWRLLPPAVT